MKVSQIAAILIALCVSVVFVVWLANSVPTMLSEASQGEGLTGNDPLAHSDGGEEGVLYENPFEIPEEGPHPVAVIEEEEYSFGRMALGKTGEHDFIIKNEGEVPLKLAKGPVQCKCTVSGLKDQEVPPGGEAKIHLEWEPKSLGGFRQGAVIYTNDPENLKPEFHVSGYMFPEIEVIPQNGWVLGTVSATTPSLVNGSITSSLHESLEITEIETSTEKLKLEMLKLTERELAELGPPGDENQPAALAGYKFVGEYTPSDKAGEFNEKVILHTNVEGYEKIELPVSGHTTGPLTIVAPGWVARNRLVKLGEILTSKGKSIKLTMMVEPCEEEMQILDVQTNPAFVKTDLKFVEGSKNASRLRYEMMIEIPAGSPSGKWFLQRPGKISVKTNHPKLPIIEIFLDMTLSKQ